MNGSPATAVVRAWVDLYTRGMPADLRAARRDEIDDDLWCEREEAAAIGRSGRALDADLLLRLVFGVPADISWRMARRGPVVAASLERSPSMSARRIGLAAIIAAVTFASLLALFVPMSHSVWTGGTGLFGVLWTLVGVIAFVVAGAGLAWLFENNIGPLGAFGAIVMAGGAFVSMGASVVPLVAGSAMLMWDLARIRGVSWLHPIVHGATALALTAGLMLGQPNVDDAGGRVVLGFLLAPFLLSWFAIGTSLVRGAPRAQAAAQ